MMNGFPKGTRKDIVASDDLTQLACLVGSSEFRCFPTGKDGSITALVRGHES